MPLIKTPARKGMSTRTSGDAEQSEIVEHSSGDAERLPEVLEHPNATKTTKALLRAAMEELRQMREEREQQQRQQEQLETSSG